MLHANRLAFNTDQDLAVRLRSTLFAILSSCKWKCYFASARNVTINIHSIVSKQFSSLGGNNSVKLDIAVTANLAMKLLLLLL